MQSLSKQTKQNTKILQAQAEAQVAPSESNKMNKKRRVDQITGGRQCAEPSKPVKVRYVPSKTHAGGKKLPSSQGGSKVKRAVFGELAQN